MMRIRAGAARIAHGGGAVVHEARVEQLPRFVFVRRRHDEHVRNAAQIAQIERAGMRGAVFADQSGAIDREQHVEILQRDIVNQLIVGALQECRINRDDRFQTIAGHAGGERHRVLLGDGDIVIAIGEALRKLHHAGAFAHGGRDADEFRFLRGHIAQPAAEHILILGTFWMPGDLFSRRAHRFGAFFAAPASISA